MRPKGDATETTSLILLIAICVVGVVLIFSLITSAYGEGCKQTQMDELKKVWDELRYWESKGSSTSYNTIPNFNVKPCVKGITYDLKRGKIVVQWTDGQEDKMPAKGRWLLCKPLIPGTYNIKVSYDRVEIIGFCEPCICKEDNSDCVGECVGSVLCGDSGVCWDGKFYSKDCEPSLSEHPSTPEYCGLYCGGYCMSEKGSDALSDCQCVSKKCEAVCKEEKMPDPIPGDKDAWTEDAMHIANWFASNKGANFDIERDSDRIDNSYSFHFKTSVSPAFSLYDALNQKYVYLPDYDKLHFWFNAPEDGEYLSIMFDTQEEWQTNGLSCDLGGFKNGWRKYTVVLDPDLNYQCNWDSVIRSVRSLSFIFDGSEANIDGLYLCRNC